MLDQNIKILSSVEYSFSTKRFLDQRINAIPGGTYLFLFPLKTNGFQFRGSKTRTITLFYV